MARGRSSRVPSDPSMPPELRDFLDKFDRRVPNSKYDATSAPGASDDADSGWQVGSVWVNLTTDNVYLCADATAGAAVWRQLN